MSKRKIDLRDYARDKPCMVRLPGICNADRATTVLAHYRLANTSGIGVKPPDLCGAWACFECHEEVDRRTRRLEKDYARLGHAEGVMRTIDEIIRELGEVSFGD